MCTVSMIGDYWNDRWKDPFFPHQQPYDKPQPKTIEDWNKILQPPITREEFEALKKEVEMMKELLKRAKLYDEKNNEPHCEMEEKVALLKAVAKMVGVSLEDVFGKDDKETIY